MNAHSLSRLVLAAALVLAVSVLGGCDPEEHPDHGAAVGAGEPGHDDHADHDDPDDHDGEEESSEHDEHEGHDEHDGPDEDGEEHDDHEGHEDEVRVEVTAEQRRRIGLTLATAGSGSVSVRGTFPGEIVLDPDRVVHVVPRAAGIVREVRSTLGDRVEAGDILAWIESDALAEAKLDYYAKQAAIGSCRIVLPRAREIFVNVTRLLGMLEKEPTLAELRALDGLEMGEYRGRLLTAYAELVATRAAFEQEAALHEEQISSARERIEAEVAHKKALAGFVAAEDTTRFQVGLEYTEALRRCRIAEFEGAAAEQRLRLVGVDAETLKKLRDTMAAPTAAAPCRCVEPDCEHRAMPSALDDLARDEKLAWNALRAPIAGHVIEKHLSLGEKADGEESVFAIADTSSVWVRFSVYQKDLAAVKPGLRVLVTPGAGGPAREGRVAYVAPTVDHATRTVPARVVLENPDGTLRPGLYATVRVDVGAVRADVVIPRDAVQIVEEREVVFVEDGDGFVAEPVTLGATDGKRVVVTSGLAPGARYVLVGAFELKAKLATSGLGAHAGHGH